MVGIRFQFKKLPLSSGGFAIAMETLIPVLNKLQDVFAKVGTDSIDLPQIVVVGAQSSGKSSVLESLVQKDFLPRGSGIVTRRPLVLQLIHDTSEYATFLHTGEKVYHNFDAVRKEIEDETDRLCGKNKGISAQSINLKVHSPNVLNLTLVDLPGLTKVATEGQPEDLPVQIRAMVLHFIKPSNAIILAISPANSDIANSDSLLIAREVDPQGRRTIGVLTKLDIMDQGTNCRDVLEGRVYPLQLGFIAVVNRSQRDIDTKKSMAAVIEDERRYFVTNPHYQGLADTNGYAYLARTLNDILMKHIKAKLPEVHQSINDLLRRKESELRGYGESFGDDIYQQQMFLYRILEHYLAEYSARLLGTSDELRKNGLDGGQYLMDYLTVEFPKKLDAIPSVLTIDRAIVARMIEANSGLQRSLFFPEATFHRLVVEQIEKMRAPSVEAAEIVHHRLMELHQRVHLNELERFPKVKQLLSQSVAEIARSSVEECIQFVSQVIEIQTSYVNSEHGVFKERTNAQLKSGSVVTNVDLLLELVDNYFKVVRRQVADTIPKVVHRILIKKSTEKLRLELFKRIVLKPDLAEAPEVALRRKKCVELIAALKNASSILNEVRMTRVA
jgi:GTPase SAR1 family protein